MRIGALPYTFSNCPKYLSDTKKKRQPLTKRISVEETKVLKKRKIVDASDENSNSLNVREESVLINANDMVRRPATLEE